MNHEITRQARFLRVFSYLSHVIESDDAATRRSQERLATWREALDPEVRRIVFGMDWIMIGREPGYPRYAASVLAFLEGAGFGPAEIDNVMAIATRSATSA